MSSRANVFITGGASGLGHALAGRYAADGGAVTILDLDSELGSAAAAKFGARFVRCDLGSPEPEALDLGAAPFDVVILNAGISAFGNFATIPWPEQQAVLDVNVSGHLQLLQQLLARNLIADGARLGFILSAAVFTPVPATATYSASKAALEGFARAIEPWLIHRQISVSLVYPGQMRTAHLKSYGNPNPPLAINPEIVARRVIRGLRRRRRSVYPDRMSLGFKILSVALSPVLPGLIYQFNKKQFAGMLFSETDR